MNVAFPAVVVFLIVLPGFIFRAAYGRTERTQIEHKPFANETALALIMSVLLHSFWAWGFEVFVHPIDFKSLLTFLVAPRNEALVAESINAGSRRPDLIGAYFLGLYVSAWLLGRSLQWAVRGLHLDVRGDWIGNLFRFDTPWFYLLKGYVHDARGADFVKVAVTVTHRNDDTFLYYGILREFYLTRDGRLDRIELVGAVRRRIGDDLVAEEDTDRFYEIVGDVLVIRYQDVTSLNLEYWREESEKSARSSAS